MAFGSSSKEGPQADINVTPLVDVVLVLLIIFMVVTPLLQVGFDADIPKEVEDMDLPEEVTQDQIVVSITETGSLMLNKDNVTEPQLFERLEKIMKGRKTDKRVVFLSGSDKLTFGQVVHIMDLCTGAGVKRVGIIEPL